jgi:hypothetical protein
MTCSLRAALVSCWLGSLLSPENGGGAFLRNIDELIPDYTASHRTDLDYVTLEIKSTVAREAIVGY